MLLDLINYTSLADRKIIDTFIHAEKPLPEAEKLFSHILNSQNIWNRRMLGEDQEYERFDIHPVSAFEKIHLLNIEQLLQIFHTADLDKVLIYKISTGDEYTSKISDILYHVANHSTYHRGQVAAEFRMNGITPPPTDYIMFKRKGEI